MFNACKHLKSIVIPSTVEYIGEQCFSDSGIESVVLPPALKGLEAETFMACENLRSVEIPSAVEYIGKDCFNKSGIESIVLPPMLKRIEARTFD